MCCSRTRGSGRRPRTAFRQAVGTEPDYAQAWHNLGSVLGEGWSPTAYVASQAALAEAVRLDSSFRDVEPGWAMDEQVRDLDLDVSRPLDPDWQFANSVEDQGAPFTAVLLVLVLLRVAWSLGLDTVIGRGAEGALARGGRFSFLATTLPAWGAGVLCVALLTGTLLWNSVGGSAVLVALGVVGLVTVPLVLRGQARHRSWVPAMAVGTVLAPLGSPFVPYPNLVATRERPTRVLVQLPALVAAVALARVRPRVGPGRRARRAPDDRGVCRAAGVRARPGPAAGRLAADQPRRRPGRGAAPRRGHCRAVAGLGLRMAP